MAGGKETPRQKMIGMMYLVLTALLALNVSKQILDAFIAIELNISNGAITQKENGDRIVDDMTLAQGKPETDAVQKQNIKIFLGVIKKIDKEAGKAIETIDNIKMELLTALNEETEEGKKDGDGDDAKILVIKKYDKSDILTPGKYDLNAIKVKDNFDVTMEVLVGASIHKDIKSYKPAGIKLWDALNTYRKRLIEITGTYKIDDQSYFVNLNKDLNDYENDSTLNVQVNKLLTDKSCNVNERDLNDLASIYQELTKKAIDLYEGAEGDSPKPIHWIGRTFNESPIVAAFASLSSLQSEILNARTKAIVLSKRKVDVSPFAFDEIKAVVTPSGLNFNPGESFTTTVSLAAYQASGQLQIQQNGGGTVVKNENGEITINMTAPASGQKIISGKVGAMNAQGKMEWRAYSTKIAVAEGSSASGSFENAEMNVLYVGYANKIIPTVSGVDDYSLSSGTPTTIDGKKAYIIKPTSKGPMTLTLTGKKGKKSFTFTKTYKCKDFPKPVLVQNSISKSGQTLTAQSSQESLVPAQFSITKVILLDGLDNPVINGSSISKAYLTKLRVGKDVGVTCYFKNLLTGAEGEIQGRLRILQ
jgi:hypothetical protein